MPNVISNISNVELEAQVAQLKAEGNALYLQKIPEAAANKYTKALQLDDQNAILYCNRAACRLAQSRIVDALEDARRAVKLDPQYIKAHVRVATALDAMGYPGVTSWARAIQLMPSENLSPAEAKQRQSYVDSLEASRLMEKKGMFSHTVTMRQDEAQGLPVELATDMLPQLRAVNNPYSSAWVIYAAHEEFHKGMEILKNLQSVPNSSKTYLVEGKTGALTNLSNGILRDRRVFAVDDPLFFDNCTDQVKMEGMHTKAWLSGSPEEVIRSAQERLRSEGWGTVRPALSISVRTRFLQGFLHSGFHGRPDMAVQYIGHAIEIVKLGRREWSNVPDSEKGAVFRETFLMGLRAEWLDQYLRAQAANTGKDSKYPLATLHKEANSLITDLKESWPRFPKGDSDPGFIYSFHNYPLGTAYAVKGYCLLQLGLMARTRGDFASCVKYTRESGTFYLKAADQYPPDEEYSIWYMKCALANMMELRGSLSLILPIMQKVRENYPKMRLIWANSITMKGKRDKQIEELLKTEKTLRELIKKNVISISDRFNSSVL